MSDRMYMDKDGVLRAYRTDEGQDPSADLANVNAAYRIERDLAARYRDALEALIQAVEAEDAQSVDAAYEHAKQMLAYDPLAER